MEATHATGRTGIWIRSQLELHRVSAAMDARLRRVNKEIAGNSSRFT